MHIKEPIRVYNIKQVGSDIKNTSIFEMFYYKEQKVYNGKKI